MERVPSRSTSGRWPWTPMRSTGCIDLSEVGYLSSLGIRSILVLEKRLKARDGGLVLAGLTPLVQNVLRVSGLDGFVRIVPTTADAIEKARASAAAEPAIEMNLGCCRAKVRRLSETASIVEWWAAGTDRGSNDQLLSISASDLGIAFGVGVLGDAAGGAGAARAVRLHAAVHRHARRRGPRDHRFHRRRRLAGHADRRRVCPWAVGRSCFDRRARKLERFLAAGRPRRTFRRRGRWLRSLGVRFRSARAHSGRSIPACSRRELRSIR